MARQSQFVRNVLRTLAERAEAAAARHPTLQHMLVLPPNEHIHVPPPPVGHPVSQARKSDLPRLTIGQREFVGALPPQASWPKGLAPLRAIVAEQAFEPFRANVQEPYRIHLFFGGNDEALGALQSLADEVDGIRADVTRAIFGNHSPFPHGVFWISPDRLHGDDVVRLDSWLCTLHWWAWAWTENKCRTQPHVVHANHPYEADRRDAAVKANLAFSLCPTGVFTASAATINLISRFFDEPPALFWEADYPDLPKIDEVRCVDVAVLANQFVRYVTNYLQWQKILNLVAAKAPPTARGSSAEAGLLRRLEDAGIRKNEAAAQIRRYGPVLAGGLERYGFDSTGVLSVVHCAGPAGGGPSYVLPTWEQTRVSLEQAALRLRQNSPPISTPPVSEEEDECNQLTDRQRDSLVVLLTWEAFDADSRRTIEEIAKAAEGPKVNADNFKTPMADLSARSLTAGKAGAQGGVWLKPRGRKLAEWIHQRREGTA